MKLIKKTPFILGIVTLVAMFAFAKQEKVIQIFRNGEIIHEYTADEIDYIEVNDLIPSPENVNASVTNNSITIKWNPVEGATYNLYRSPDNSNFTLLASKLTEPTYTDSKPLSGSNFYRVKAVVGDVESGYTASAAATLTNSELENGIYLGVTGFNQALYEYPVLQLTEASVDGFRSFVDGLNMKNGTLLYYSVDAAINAMQSTELPSDLSTAAIVTFTDGLDQGSMMMDVPYDDDMAYLDALNQRIKNETVSGQSINAYSIGIRGKDVADINMFRANLAKLASAPENATEVTSMAEVNAKFKEIAETLSESNYVQTINLKMPGLSNGTMVRFTFDNVNSAAYSKIYIQGKFNLKEKSLEDIEYVGLTSTSGATVKGTVDGIFVNFTFDGVHTEENILIKSEFTDEWTYIATNGTWQINSEFDKTENSEIITKKSSAVIMLVLDCSSSLADDFVKAQANAKDFISTLYQAVGGVEKPGEDEETIYSTTPKDLSVAIWKDGKRYYLTPLQYITANLKNATVEGLAVLSNMGNFIISPNLLQSQPVRGDLAVEYYGELLPDRQQASIISARYVDINNTLQALGWQTLIDYYGSSDPKSYSYLTKTEYNEYDIYYTLYLGRYNGGDLSCNDRGLVRGVVSLEMDEKIIWNSPNDLSLSAIKDGVRYFINDAKEDLSQFEEIEGIAVMVKGVSFIINLRDAQSGPIQGSTALSLYGDILPSETIARIISMRWNEINKALEKFGGLPFITTWSTWDPEKYYYLTKTKISEGGNNFYTLYLGQYKEGDLGKSAKGLVRGIKLISTAIPF